MKKILTILFAIVISNTMSAQEIGIKLGTNLTNIYDDGSIESDTKIGINGGVTAQFPLTDVVSFKTGLLYSERGAQDGDSDLEMSLYFSYLDIPFDIMYYVTDKISLNVGPNFGVLLIAKNKISGSFLGQTVDENIDIKEDMKALDLGINIGTSLYLNESLSINAGYQLGVTNFVDGDAKTNHSVIQFSLSYSLNN